MTDEKPKCHHDKNASRRMLLTHRPDCNARACGGCVPCDERHCFICGRNHTTDVAPNTCPSCVGDIRGDLKAIADTCRLLRDQAANAGDNGALAAAAPIPGAAAMVLIGPSTNPLDVLMSRHHGDDHSHADPQPPLLVLAGWEDVWRDWLEQPTSLKARISRAVDYLDKHLTQMAQTIDPQERGDQAEIPPDFAQFAHDIAGLRTRLEHALHDEREPDRGVACFECGTNLVRRHRTPTPCGCLPRPAVHGPHDRCRCETWDPAHTHPHPDVCCLACHWELIHAWHDQGGVEEPTAGLGWECPACRLKYTPTDYAQAVQGLIVDKAYADGWTTVERASVAAEAMVETAVPPNTIRQWTSRLKVRSCCSWTPGHRYGIRLVFWPDVAERAVRPPTRRKTTAA